MYVICTAMTTCVHYVCTGMLRIHTVLSPRNKTTIILDVGQQQQQQTTAGALSLPFGFLRANFPLGPWKRTRLVMLRTMETLSHERNNTRAWCVPTRCSVHVCVCNVRDYYETGNNIYYCQRPAVVAHVMRRCHVPIPTIMYARDRLPLTSSKARFFGPSRVRICPVFLLPRARGNPLSNTHMRSVTVYQSLPRLRFVSFRVAR